MLQTPIERAAADRFWLIIITIFSVVAVIAVAFILTGDRTASELNVSMLPAVNTAWNAIAAVCLVAAFIAIRRRKIKVHQILVLAAFSASTLFLTGYLIYHVASGGSKPYEGPTPWLYYPILTTHIILAISIIPLSLVTLRRGWTRHRHHHSLARVTLPIWLYVSVTGVLIYALLYGPSS